MAEIRVARVDERNNNWERYDPRFRVYLHGSGATSTHGWTDTYDITGATILQVIDWAQRQAGGVLTYSVALVHDDSDRERMQPVMAAALSGWWAWTETTRSTSQTG